MNDRSAEQKGRELSKAELECVLGGYADYHVSVRGVREPWSDFSWGGGYDTMPSGGSVDVPEDNSSVGGGTDPDHDPDCTCQQGTVDQQSDSAAGRIAGAILSNSLSGFDWTKHEAGAIIYRDAFGQTQITALRTDYSSSGLTLDYAAYGLSASQVIGVVHNHPKVNDDSLQQAYNNAYNTSISISQAAVINGHPSVDDWSHAEALVHAGANASELTVYIVDSRGMIREYQYADMAKWKADMENFRVSGTEVDNNVDCPVH